MSYIDDLKTKLNIDKIAGYRLSLIAGKGIIIEGHKGLYHLSEDEVKIRIRKGSITILGKDLTIKEISSTEIYILGSIEGINL